MSTKTGQLQLQLHPSASITPARFLLPDGRPAPGLRPLLGIDQAAALISFDIRDSDHCTNASRRGRCRSRGGGITTALVGAGVSGSLCCRRQGRGWVVCAAAGLWGLFWLWAGLCGSGA